MVKGPLAIEFRHLRYFFAGVEQRSFRKAGAALGVKESTVSRAIRDLEDQLGASLFQRSNDGVRLTAAGKQFLARARMIVRQVSDSAIDILAIGSGARGRIRIGIVTSIAKGALFEFLREFSSSHTDVHIELVDGEPAEHLAALQRFELDIAFLVGGRQWQGCEAATLCSEHLQVLLAADHPLSHRTELSWAELVNETFIVGGTAPDKELRTILMIHCAELGRIPTLQAQDAGYRNLLPLVALGRGLMLSFEHEVALGIVHRPIRGAVIPFAAVWLPDNDNPALRRFLSITRRRSPTQAELHGAMT